MDWFGFDLEDYFQTNISPVAGRYSLCAELGRGAKGVVYRGRDERGEFGEVSVKLLRRVDTKNAARTGQFLAEASRLYTLAHPNLVQILDFGVEPSGQLYLVMEYAPIVPLSERMQMNRKSFSFLQASSVLLQIAKGLAYAHKQGFVHQALKPSSIFVTSAGAVKVGHVALSSFADVGYSEPATAPYYLAPEQFVVGKPQSETVDIYVLGVIAYELANHAPPFQGDYYEVANAHKSAAMPRFQAVGESFPEWYQILVYKCTEKTPERRYRSMDEIIDFIVRNFLK